MSDVFWWALKLPSIRKGERVGTLSEINLFVDIFRASDGRYESGDFIDREVGREGRLW